MLQALSGRPAVPRSFLSVEPESVLATALFVHRGRAYIRLWNMLDRESRAVVHLEGGDGLGTVDFNLENSRTLPDKQVPLRPWGIQTVAVVPAPGGS